MLTKCFVYGTLMSPEVLQTLIGRVPSMCKPAFLPNFTRHPVKGYAFPAIIPSKESSDRTTSSSGSSNNNNLNDNNDNTTINSENNGVGIDVGVEGILLTGLTRKELEIFNWFEDEGELYTRCTKSVSISIRKDGDTDTGDEYEKQVEDAYVYIWCNSNDMLHLEKQWDYHHFQQNEVDSYLENTVRPCRNEIDRIGIGS
jgi:hypothetical protein